MIFKTLESSKARFFDEGNFDRPLKHKEWRGCVVDRDYFDNVRMPEVLWSTLIDICSPKVVSICGFFDGTDACASTSANWSALKEFMLNPKNYSPEYLIFDRSGRWAISADEDVTTFGADSHVADRIDSQLSKFGTSLLELTLDSFTKEDLMSEGGSYIRGVVRGLASNGQPNGTEVIKPTR